MSCTWGPLATDRLDCWCYGIWAGQGLVLCTPYPERGVSCALYGDEEATFVKNAAFPFPANWYGPGLITSIRDVSRYAIHKIVLRLFNAFHRGGAQLQLVSITVATVRSEEERGAWYEALAARTKDGAHIHHENVLCTG